MKRIVKNLLIAGTIVFTHLSGLGQVKIGDNPTVINSSSLLELESTTKGLVLPRMTTTQKNAITSPATGLEIYDTDTKLFNYYNGSAWKEVSNQVRANYVIVKSNADFPTPSAGVITLDATTTYEINGSITVSDKIDLNDAKVFGLDRFDDKIIYTGSTELFTGTNGGEVRSVTITAAVAGSQVFNVANVAKTKEVLVINCIITGSKKSGTIEGYLAAIFESNCFLSTDDGLSFKNIGHLLLINNNFFDSNKGTYVKLVDASTMDFVQINGGFFHSNLANSATSLDFGTGVTVTFGGRVFSNFHGDGTATTGSPGKEWEIFSTGLDTQTDDVAGGAIYVSTSATTPIAGKNTPIKVAGTTTAVNLFRTTAPVDNRLVYTGTKTRFFSCVAAISVTASNNGKRFKFYLAKNGTLLQETVQSRKIANGADIGSISLSSVVELAPNDYLEVWVENINDGTDITAESMNFSIR